MYAHCIILSDAGLLWKDHLCATELFWSLFRPLCW